jgi:hypothetical protein
MLAREVNRRYLRELGGAMILYGFVLVGAMHFGKPMPPGAARTLLLLTPVVPIGLAVWVIARQFGRMDEFVRLRSLESIAVGAAVTAACSFTYGFLELVGFPRLSMFWVWPVMGLAWAATSAARALFSR